MQKSLCTLLMAMSLAAAGPSLAQPTVGFERQDGRLEIHVDGRPAAIYVWEDPKILRPYLTALRAPEGTQVTRNRPPLAGDATDHDTMHPGLWLGFGDISGVDFWRNKGRVEVRFVAEPSATGNRGRFQVENRYLSADRLLCREQCQIDFSVTRDGYLLVWDSRFSGDADFYFGDQEEMGLGIRLATPLTVKAGGEITNSDGLKNEKQVWGKQADWCDYSGTIDGQRLGVTLMPDPGNFRRSWFHARDYGFVAANPFGVNAFTQGPKSKVEVHRGSSLRLRYGVLVHSGPIDLTTVYQDWKATAK